MDNLTVEEMNQVLANHEAQDDFAGGTFENVIGERDAKVNKFEFQEPDEKLDTYRINIDLEITEGQKDAGRRLFDTIWLNRDSGLKKIKNVAHKVLGKNIMTFPEIQEVCKEIHLLNVRVKCWEKKPQKKVGDKWVTDEDKLAEKGKKQMVSFLGKAKGDKAPAPF